MNLHRKCNASLTRLYNPIQDYQQRGLPMCKKHYTHLSEEEKYMIEGTRKDEISLRKIAHRLRRSVSTISRDMRRNQGLRGSSASPTNKRRKATTFIWWDKDLRGEIRATEKNQENKIWEFGSPQDYPAIRCTPDSLADQRHWWFLNRTTGKPQLNSTRLLEVLTEVGVY